MRTHFDTREFVQSHGRPPQGRGTWIFRGVDGTTAQETGKFSAARARVARAFPAVGVWSVLP